MAIIGSSHFLSLAMLVVVGTLTLGLGDNHMVSAQCGTNVPDLVLHCARYVKVDGPKENPDQACCHVITGLDIPCVCKYVTPEVQKMVSMEKVVYVARTCGLTLQPGMKCGSFVVPPPLV
ncbi:hypothetical protein Tsubulata_000763 [Turnera subulata]|uniref:Bifunctional inhibitor/plant lipid transfer protein/seed storage helical domain-containing protein n=1 Tax=Turnera subulata TaxID=218843 RepID=A0A9Q0GA36_9ROSI|nr:hypothetical protein Tsubulata_000763 [Turnera subulata]